MLVVKVNQMYALNDLDLTNFLLVFFFLFLFNFLVINGNFFSSSNKCLLVGHIGNPLHRVNASHSGNVCIFNMSMQLQESIRNIGF
jgi:hypothetical protein